jgi:hypothetical protein
MTNKLIYILACTLMVIFEGCGCSTTKNISLPRNFPEFFLPPPQPSATDEISKSYFTDCKTINDINLKLSSALDKCGYLRKSYFYVANGFALVTQLEKINEDGSLKPENERWTIDEYNSHFSLRSYLRRLLYANPGFYRCIVFIITDSYYKYSENLATQKQTREWLISGTNRLPVEISKIVINDNYSFNVLIYEFKKNETETESNILIPSSITGRNHLINSKIYDQLK